jgi:plasmid stabilization system protein ParE
MKVVFTDEALANLDGILSFIASNYPSIYDAFQSRLRSVVARIGTGRRAPRKWPTGRGSSPIDVRQRESRVSDIAVSCLGLYIEIGKESS